MRKIDTHNVIASVKAACITANRSVPEDVARSLNTAQMTEKSPTGKIILSQINNNIKIAHEKLLPICQDTGIVVVFVEIGTDCYIDGSLTEAINEGVRQGYDEGFLRKSVVSDPLQRKNTGDNTPAIIHITEVPGNAVKMIIAPKGGGCENVSKVLMLTPSDSRGKWKDIVVEWVRNYGANACPPVIVGVGIGGNFESCAIMAKHALVSRTVGSPHSDAYYDHIERELLERINNSGVGPMGVGGINTALAVFIESAPCHIASLPLAINLNCHATRHLTVSL